MKKGFTLREIFDRDDINDFEESLVDLFRISIKRRGSQFFTFIISPSGEELDITDAMNFTLDTYQGEIKEKVLNYIMRTYVFKNEEEDNHYYRYDEVLELFKKFQSAISSGSININEVIQDGKVNELDPIFSNDLNLYLLIQNNDNPKDLKMAKTPGVCIRLGKALSYILKKYM